MFHKFKVGDMVMVNKDKGLYHGDHIHFSKAYENRTRFQVKEVVERMGLQEIQTDLVTWWISNQDLIPARKPLIVIEV